MIPLPSEKDWRVITYRPQPLYTRTSDYRALEYWQSVYGPNTSIEVNVEQDRLERDNFMGHLRSGIPIIVTPDPDKIECYAEPLATIHKQFWDAASAVVWEVYPMSKGSRRNSREWHSAVHSILADMYWGASIGDGWKEYTPGSWVDQLNMWLSIAAACVVRSEQDLEVLRHTMLSATTGRVNAYMGGDHTPESIDALNTSQ